MKQQRLQLARGAKTYQLHSALGSFAAGEESSLLAIVKAVEDEAPMLRGALKEAHNVTKRPKAPLPDYRETWTGVVVEAMTRAVESRDHDFLQMLWAAGAAGDPGDAFIDFGASVGMACILCRNLSALKLVTSAGAYLSDYAVLTCIESIDPEYVRNAYGLCQDKPDNWLDVFEFIADLRDVNIAEAEHGQPLHWASAFGFVDAVSALLGRGANPLLRSSDGLRASEVVPGGKQNQKLRSILAEAEKSAMKDTQMITEAGKEPPGWCDPKSNFYLFDRVSRAPWYLGSPFSDDDYEVSIDRTGRGVMVCQNKTEKMAEDEGVPSYDKAARKVPERLLAIQREHSVDVTLPRLIADLIWRYHLTPGWGVATDEYREHQGKIEEAIVSLVLEHEKPGAGLD